MQDRRYEVLFLCTGNSARSVLAECILNRVGRGRFRAHSAGSMPTGAINPFVLDLLRRRDFVVDSLRSKSWSEFSGDGAPSMDFVFTVCDSAAAEVCPVWPGQPASAHWGIRDPAAVEGTDAEKRLAAAEAYRELTSRIEAFVGLPIARLDRRSLQRELDAIGKLAASPG